MIQSRPYSPRSFAMIFVASLFLALTATQARADQFNFTIGPDASGFFTTGAASTTDPGYFLLTGIEFTSISGTDSDRVTFSYQNEIDSEHDPGAAYDPTTGAFVNHFAGQTYTDSGTINTQDISDFKGLGRSSYSGFNRNDLNGQRAGFSLNGSLAITPQTSPVPEPSSWALLATGCLALAFTVYRKGEKRGSLHYAVR